MPLESPAALRNQPPRPETDYDAFDALWNKLTEIDAGISRAVKKSESMPLVDPRLIVDIYDVVPNSTLLTLTNSIDFPALITSIMLSIPLTSAGTLTIGRRQIPVGAGLTPGLGSIQMLLLPHEVITLSSSVSGTIYLELMGGLLRNPDWRKIA